MNGLPALDQQLTEKQTRLVRIGGNVQGVGFRPHLYRLAEQHAIAGWARNSHSGVELLAHGVPDSVEQFLQQLIEHAPAISSPRIEQSELIDDCTIASTPRGFTIIGSSSELHGEISLPRDLDCCPDCLEELFQQNSRRYRDPFINCTACGPRYTSINRLPYDRTNTAMAGFRRCEECDAEYNDPTRRRFHAEAICCPDCGPQLNWVDSRKKITNTSEALAETVRALNENRTVAVKGVGGYHLLCAADSDQAVARLRARKGRPDKPLAVMFPQQGNDGLEAVCRELDISGAEASLIIARSRPIVLCDRRDASNLSTLIAPGTNRVGTLLPYSPLHHLILSDFGRPLVATSANISGEPVMTEATEVEKRLSGIADAFLHHNREIIHPADDSLFHIVNGQPRPLRLGRGHTPLELPLPFQLSKPLLAVGGEMKNTIALAWDKRIVISPHIGELHSPRSGELFKQTIAELQRHYRVSAEEVICDAHPNYFSHRWAESAGIPATQVYHHHAHATAVAGEFNINGKMLVFTWDGSGYGEDGTLWGGEALLGEPGNWQRVATFRRFRLPGGEQAAREPWRCSAALHWETDREWNHHSQASLLHRAWQQQFNAPQTTSVGRLFNGAAALLGLIEKATYEGHAAMALQSLAEAAPIVTAEPLPYYLDAGMVVSDWAPLLDQLNDSSRPAAQRAAQFHSRLAHTLCDQAITLREQHGEFVVGLNGGVFQNRLLTEQVIALLEQQGFEVYLPQQLPCNDAALCYGQIIEAATRL